MSAAKNPRAFPSAALDSFYGGMSLRDWFAGQALPGMLSTNTDDSFYRPDGAAEYAYAIADAMLAERDKAAALGAHGK